MLLGCSEAHILGCVWVPSEVLLLSPGLFPRPFWAANGNLNDRSKLVAKFHCPLLIYNHVLVEGAKSQMFIHCFCGTLLLMLIAYLCIASGGRSRGTSRPPASVGRHTQRFQNRTFFCQISRPEAIRQPRRGTLRAEPKLFADGMDGMGWESMPWHTKARLGRPCHALACLGVPWHAIFYQKLYTMCICIFYFLIDPY